MKNYQIVSDGTPMGTQLLTEDGAEALACSRLTWTVDAQAHARLVIEVAGARIDAKAANVEVADASYAAGRRAAARDMLRVLMPDIEDESEREIMRLRMERAEAVDALREVCEFLDTKEWPDDLYLADIIRNYVMKPLAEIDEAHNSTNV